MVFGPIAIAYNVNGVTSLNIDGPTAARIFNGGITTWNDPAIQVLNPGVTLPAEPIRVVFRSDESGTTDNFQKYLDTASNGAWGRGAGKRFNGGVGEGAKGYNALNLNSSGTQPKVIQDILKYVHDKGQGTGPKDEVGSVLYTRGVIIQMLGVEAVRRAQERFGKGKVVTSEQVRWGLENLALDQKKLDALGFAGIMKPLSTSCADHMGSTWVRVQTWDGKK